MLHVDLEAAGIAYEIGDGVVDFHALRATYVSHLVSSGAPVKTCQVLARHSTPSLTIGIDAKASPHDVRAAVEALPNLAARRRGPRGGRIGDRLPTICPPEGTNWGAWWRPRRD